jgi:excisionase family DNA binding protein
LKTKKLEITIETYERLIIKQDINREIPCDRCGQVVQMLKPEEAAKLLGISTRTIYRWIESDRLHYVETPDHLLLICHPSLLQIN